jgi:hypothetical protein
MLWTLRQVVSWNDPSAACRNVLALHTNSGTAPLINPTAYYYDIKLPLYPLPIA